MTYNIYLADRGLPGSNIPEDLRESVKRTLEGWFAPIVQMTTPPVPGGVVVSWVDARPPIQPNELLVFFVQSQGFSVVNHLPHVNVSNRTLSGLTGWSHGFTCSEVYIDYGTRFFSQIVFHEMLHNKTHMGNHALHSHDGLARTNLQDPMAAPTPANETLMAQHLLSNKPQWLDGFQF